MSGPYDALFPRAGLQSNGTVSFVATGSSPTVEQLYTCAPGQAPAATPLPGASSSATSPEASPGVASNASGTQVITVRDYDSTQYVLATVSPAGAPTIIAKGGTGQVFSSIAPEPAIGPGGQVAFIATAAGRRDADLYVPKSLTNIPQPDGWPSLSDFYAAPKDASGNYPAGPPAIDSSGQVLTTAPDGVLLYNSTLSSPTVVATSGSGTSACGSPGSSPPVWQPTGFGQRPAISDDGKAIAFTGNQGNGLGLFLCVKEAGSGWNLLTIAGAPKSTAGESDLGDLGLPVVGVTKAIPGGMPAASGAMTATITPQTDYVNSGDIDGGIVVLRAPAPGGGEQTNVVFAATPMCGEQATEVCPSCAVASGECQDGSPPLQGVDGTNGEPGIFMSSVLDSDVSNSYAPTSQNPHRCAALQGCQDAVRPPEVVLQVGQQLPDGTAVTSLTSGTGQDSEVAHISARYAGPPGSLTLQVAALVGVSSASGTAGQDLVVATRTGGASGACSPFVTGTTSQLPCGITMSALGMTFTRDQEAPNVSTPQALAVPYPDSVGYCTFGYGYLIAKKACSDLDKPYKDAWRTVTKPTDAMALFYSYTYSQNQKVAAVLPQGVPLTQNQLDALDDWVYNVGTTAFTTPPSQVLTDLEYTNTDSQVQNTVRYLEAPRFFFRIITAKSKVSCDAIQRRADDYYMFTQGKYTNTGYYGCFYLTHIYRSSAGPGSPWGPVGGGDVTLTGDPHDPFTGPVTVWFDGDPVTVTGNNQTTLTVKMPAHVVEGAQTTGNTGFIVATSGQRPANCTQAQTGCGYTPPPLALMELPPPTATATQIKIFNSGTVAPGFCYLGPAGTQTNPPPYQQCVTATSTGQTVTLKWAAPPTGAPAITSYTIQRGTAPNAQGDKNPHGETTVKTITCGSSPNPCSTLTYSDKPGNGTFYYTVTATDANDHTNVSNQVKATLPAPGAAGAPAASNPQPQLRRARPRASAGTGTPVVQLSWTVPADGGSPVTGYDILRGTTSGGETYLTSTDPAQTSYVDTSVTAGTTYYYQVVAVNAVGDSPPSNEVTAVPYMATPPQPPPLSATSGNHSVQLSWSAPADGGLPVTGYNIYRGTVSGGETYFDSVPASATSYTDDTVTGGITYYYQVTATNLLGESQPSNEVSVTPTGPGPCPLTSNQVIWTGGAGTNDWADGANWSTGSQPGPSANVCIPATSLSSISSTGNVTVNSVDTSTPLSLGVGGAYPTFTIAGTASESYFHADVTVGSGEVFTLDDTAVVDSSATFSIQGVAALEGTGDLDITSTATLDWTPGCSPDVCAYWTGGTITNQGTTDLTGDVIVDGGTLFDNTGTLVVGGGTQFAGTATSEVLSTGTVTGACGTTTMECSVEGDLRLNGPVQADTGELILAEDGSTPQEGVFSVAAGASLEFAGSGTTSFTAPAPISGAGTLILAGATVNLTGTISVPEVQVTGGTTNLDTSLAVPLLDLQQGTLAGSGPVTVASGGTFTQAGGSLSGAVDLTIQSGGTLDWADGEQQGSGTTLVDAGATAALTQDSVTLGDTRQFTNNGTLTQTADIVVEGGTATNGGSWAINGGYGYADNGDTWAGSAFTNTGTLTVAAGTGTATVGLFPTNSGTVTVQSGTLALENDQEGTTATSTGSFTVAASATLDLAAGTSSTGFDLTAASSVTGTGTMALTNNPAVTVDGTFTIANVTQYGDLTLDVPATPASFTLTGGTLAGSGSVTIPSGGTFTQAGGSLSGAVDLTIQNGGTLNWQNGEEQGSGSTLVASGATAQIFQSQAELGDTRQFTNNGTLTQDQNILVLGGAVTNAGTWAINGDYSVSNDGDPSPVTFTNNGTLTKAAGTGTSTIGDELDNNGTLAIPAGTISTGTYTQPSGGTIQLQLQSTTPGTGFGLLTVSGTASIAGTLALTTAGGTPPPGSSYPFLTASTLSGCFTTIQNPSTGGTFTVTCTSTSATVMETASGARSPRAAAPAARPSPGRTSHRPASQGGPAAPGPMTPGRAKAALADFGGVSCISATACTAVGSYHNSAGGTAALAEAWNGTTWSIQAIPKIKAAATSVLSAVSCTSARACTAVGHYTTAGKVTVGLAEAWNGTTWSIQPTPAIPGAAATYLDGISCASARTCTAVGRSASAKLVNAVIAESWNGTKWSLQATPKIPGASGGFLAGISCPTATACTAVGQSSNHQGNVAALTEAWNGTTWSIQATPRTAGSTVTDLAGVSCTSPAACTAVGSRNTRGANPTVLTETWNGNRWAIQAAPARSTWAKSFLSSISCTSVTACTAVGGYLKNAAQNRALAETWNGTTWSIATTPSPRRLAGGFFASLSCPSATICTATGPVIERRNGTTWSIQATPRPGPQAQQLHGSYPARGTA